ncbi:hypothetical protein EVAR_9626_1 [Eumeta japonica]|uniref:Uncharacterized protein n=1 Tax=Eumeta variegata TaxID=151549 RepID=A0A4C1TJM7_EUMVA|nr:hypothetical protein EVAR_9626_1 [Eumeta japonica]
MTEVTTEKLLLSTKELLSRVKEACESPESRWSSPPMDTRSGVTSVLLASGSNRISDEGESELIEVAVG